MKRLGKLDVQHPEKYITGLSRQSWVEEEGKRRRKKKPWGTQA